MPLNFAFAPVHTQLPSAPSHSPSAPSHLLSAPSHSLEWSLGQVCGQS